MSFSGIYLPDTPVRKPDVNGNSLLRKIHRACRLSLPEPDLSLNLDVADYINSKQGNTSRDAAITIVKLINTRGTHTAVFALCLLDVLVKNCGYPIHLQISRKEFLNELVKRFPERPPLRYTKVQRLILTAIEEWYQTICKHSSYKEDMKYIRDMHSLLKYKGYVFPKINQEDLAVLRPHDRLKTPSEILKEQEVAQAAKLEELIRRGTPEDLREANKLMKVMAGYKEDNAVNAKQTLLDDLTKLKRKADLLDEMLDASTYTELDNETIVELYSSLKSAQPKFQDIIDEQQADDSLVKDMLQFNDIVNQLLRKYQVLKNETPSAPLHVASPSPANSGATTLANEINLIDFGDDDGEESPGLSSGGLDPVDDILTELNSLKFVQTPLDFGKGGSISFGPATPQPLAPVATSHAHDSFDLLGDDSPAALPSNTVTMPQLQALKLSADTSPIDEERHDVARGPADRVVIHQSENLKADVQQTRLGDSKLKIISYFSNLSSTRIDDLTFMVAVPKSCTLNLLPQSASSIAGETRDGITQEFFIEHPTHDQYKRLKIKWKIMYTLDGSPMEVSSISNLPKV